MANIMPYEISHPIGRQIPKSVSLDSLNNRSDPYRGSGFGRYGDLITFPGEESEVSVYTIDGRYRFIIVIKNGEEAYFPIAWLYQERKDFNSKEIIKPSVRPSFAKVIEQYESDAEIIRALLGHTIKFVKGVEFTDFKAHTQRMLDFELLDPPLTTNNRIWYPIDSSDCRMATEEYIKLQNQLVSCGIREYLATHHMVADSSHLYLLMDSGFNLNDDGVIVATVAIKDSYGHYTILREATIGISPLSLLERKLDSKYNYITAGIPKVRTVSTLKRLLDSSEIIMEFTIMPFERPIFKCHPIRLSDITISDDIGKLAFPSKDEVLSTAKVALPVNLKNRKYSLVGTNYHAPHTKTKGISCILIAQDNNPYDSNAIEVRRWFPIKLSDFSLVEKTPKIDVDIHDGVYELGFISRQENQDLHNYMMENGCRLLFAETDATGKISIIGGIEQFSVGALKGIACPFSLFNTYSNR
jgi:hypothetical protein